MMVKCLLDWKQLDLGKSCSISTIPGKPEIYFLSIINHVQEVIFFLYDLWGPQGKDQ